MGAEALEDVGFKAALLVGVPARVVQARGVCDSGDVGACGALIRFEYHPARPDLHVPEPHDPAAPDARYRRRSHRPRLGSGGCRGRARKRRHRRHPGELRRAAKRKRV